MMVHRLRATAMVAAVAGMVGGGSSTARANMKLDLDLVVCSTGSGSSFTRMGRVTIKDAAGATVFTQPSVPIYIDEKCIAEFTVSFTPALLDLYLNEELFITVEKCGSSATTCGFSAWATTLTCNHPMNTLLSDVIDYLALDLDAVYEYIDAQVAAEAAARAAGDAALQANVDAEIAARIAAVSGLESGLNAETAARVAADVALQGNLDAEAAARVAADVALQSNLDAETAARAAADALLQGNLDAEVAARADGDALLQSNLDGEAAARAAADTGLQSSLDAEAVARADEDALLQSSLDGEAAARAAADTGLQSGLDAETAARAAADTALQSSIDGETAARIAGDAGDIQVINGGVGISVSGAGGSRTITNTGDTDPGDDIVSIATTGGLTVSGSGGSRQIGHVSWTCPAGSSLREISAAGGILCETDDTSAGGGDDLGSHVATMDLDMTNHSIQNLRRSFGSSSDYVYSGSNTTGSQIWAPYYDSGAWVQGPEAGLQARATTASGQAVAAFNISTGSYAYLGYSTRGVDAHGSQYGIVAQGATYGVYAAGGAAGWAIYAEGQINSGPVFNRDTGAYMKSVAVLYTACGGCGTDTGMMVHEDTCGCGFMGCTEDEYVCLDAH